MTGLVATAETDVHATPEQVWAALVDPGMIAKYMFGTRVETDWRPGSPITWSGEYQGRQYRDHGQVLEVEPNRLLRVTHFSPLTGQPDTPENYHQVTYRLTGDGDHTHVTLSQDNNSSPDEAEHSRANWDMMLQGLKQTVEAS